MVDAGKTSLHFTHYKHIIVLELNVITDNGTTLEKKTCAIHTNCFVDKLYNQIVQPLIVFSCNLIMKIDSATTMNQRYKINIVNGM